MNKRILPIVLWTIWFPIVGFLVWSAIFAIWAYAAGGRIFVYEIVIWAFWASMFVLPLAALGLGVTGILPGTRRRERAPS